MVPLMRTWVIIWSIGQPKRNPSSLGISDDGCYPFVAGLLKRHRDEEEFVHNFSKYGKSL